MTSATLPERTRVLVVGAGFAGLGMAIKLKEAGYADFAVVEKGDTVGGTWRDNTYPGAACDVPSHLYSFSFAPGKEWSRFFGTQPEIQAYLEKTASESGVLDRFHFGVTVEDLAYDEADRTWTVTTDHGTVVADAVVNGAGVLSEPKLPEIDGIESFAGHVFHSARWNHDVDLTGKRVAIIGTGASAVQIIPELAKKVGHLDVYQRTAAWVIPRSDPTFTQRQRFVLRHVPLARAAVRSGIYLFRESLMPGFTRYRALSAPVKRLAQENLDRRVPDPVLREKLTPHFEVGCKRLLISNTYYPALSQENVEVVTDGIARVTPTGIVTADGTEREIDALVIATGFAVTDHPIAHHVKGRRGRTLADAWAEDGMAAYKGTTFSGFPNFFMIPGPNTGLGHSSMVYMIESQIAYVVSALQQMGARQIATVEPRPEAVATWNDDLQRRLEHSVWNSGGCASWYLDAHGKNTTLWPRATFTFRRLLRRFDLDKYVVTSATEPTTSKEQAA